MNFNFPINDDGPTTDTSLDIDINVPQPVFNLRAFQDSIIPFVELDSLSTIEEEVVDNGKPKKKTKTIVSKFEYVEETKKVAARLSEKSKVLFVYDPNPIVEGKWLNMRLGKYDYNNLDPMLNALAGKTVYLYWARKIGDTTFGELSYGAI